MLIYQLNFIVSFAIMFPSEICYIICNFKNKKSPNFKSKRSL